MECISFYFFKLKKKIEGMDGNKLNGLKKLIMFVKIGYFKVIM